MKRNLLIATIFLLLTSLVSAGDIAIESVFISPKEAEPGEDINIRIILENQGDEDIESIFVSLDLSLSNIPLIPIGSAASKIIDEIKNDDSRMISFDLKVSSDAESGIYKIPILISYRINNEPINEDSVISLEVFSNPILEVAIEESEVYTLNKPGDITIRFVNKGLSDIKFLSAKIDQSPLYDILSANSFYIGNIEPDDFETSKFRLNIKEKINFLPISIEYRDEKNKLHQEVITLNLKLYSEEEALSLGLEKKSQLPLIITIIILIIVLFLIFRYIRKRRKAKLLGS